MLQLQDQLDQISEQTRSLVQPERLQPSENAVAELFSSGIEQQILPVGSIAPEFSLPDVNGRIVRSADLLALGPLVINFFRGRWCPYCLAELEAWRNFYPELRKRGALLVAISPQTVHQNDLLQQQHPLPFPVLSDAGSGGRGEFPHCLHRSGLSPEALPQHPGEHSIYQRRSFLATFAAGHVSSASDGSIVFAQAHADFRVRPEPEEVLAALDRELSR